MSDKNSVFYISIDYNNLVSYEDICDKIRPFDLIAFRGEGIISDTISSAQSHIVGVGSFSHVGMVVTSDILPYFNVNGEKIYLDPGKIYIFESTTAYNLNGDIVPDITTGLKAIGVQIRDLKEVIPRYITSDSCRVAWCKLLKNPLDQIGNESTSNTISERFQECFLKYQGRMYELSLIGLLSSGVPSFRKLRTLRENIYNKMYSILRYFGLVRPNNVGPSGWQFCSELVANIYKEFGIIPETIDPKNVMPIDFFGCDEDGLPIVIETPVFIKDFTIAGQPAISYN